MYRPLYDADNLRSLNLTMFVVVEASEVEGEAYTQLNTRLRNMAAAIQKKDEQGKLVFEIDANGTELPVYEKDWRRGIIESNPDSGWIRTDILYASDEIHKHGHVVDEYTVPEHARNPFISSHVASTDVNRFLPPTFIEELCKNKPAWWTARYIFSSFSYAEGLVYPSSGNCVVKAFEVDKRWKRIIAADYGLHDDFVYLYGAIDQMNGVLHIYKEVRTNNQNIEELSRIYHEEAKDIPAGGLLTAPILDPKSGAKRDYNKKTLYDHFLDFGIAFQPGHISLDARIYRLNTYFESGKLLIHDCCDALIKELNDYKFPSKKLGTSTKAADKPVDKNNHGINPLEWICMALPADPKKLYYGVYDQNGNDLTQVQEARDSGIPFALQDVEETFDLYERSEW